MKLTTMATQWSEYAPLLAGAQQQYTQLVLIVGNDPEHNAEALAYAASLYNALPRNLTRDIGALLTTVSTPSDALIELAQSLTDQHSPCFFDAIDILFAKPSPIRPLQWLQNLARHQLVVATWTGPFIHNVLTYATPGHQEYLHESHIHVTLVNNDA